jgi:DNA-binding NarL/FixJ family response regulator
MRKIRVIVVEDELLLRQLLIERLAPERDVEVVAEAGDGQTAVELAARLRPDVILMDLEMPVLTGLEAAERIHAAQPVVQIIMLTVHRRLVSVRRHIGVADWLDKNCSPQQLVSTIRQVAAQIGSVSNAQCPMSNVQSQVRYPANLSPRERCVLELIVEQDLTNAQIARTLSREVKRSVSESAVKNALVRIMNKLDVEPRTRAALVKKVLAQSNPSQD